MIRYLKRKNLTGKHLMERTAIFIILMTLLLTSTVCAAPNTWAKNASDWIQDGAKTLGLALTTVFAISYLAKRKFIQALTFFILAAVILAIIVSPTLLQTIGTGLLNIIFK